MNRETTKKFIALLFLVGILASCSSESLEKTNQINNDYEKSIINQDQESSYLETDESSIQGYSLSVNEKCIGCGHCPKFAPDNFKMSGRKAIVISHENIESNGVQKAIDRCPVSAIEIS